MLWLLTNLCSYRIKVKFYLILFWNKKSSATGLWHRIKYLLQEGQYFQLRFLSIPYPKSHYLNFDTKFSSPLNGVMDQKKPHKFSANHVPYVLVFFYLTNLHILHILLLLQDDYWEAMAVPLQDVLRLRFSPTFEHSDDPCPLRCAGYFAWRSEDIYAAIMVNVSQ